MKLSQFLAEAADVAAKVGVACLLGSVALWISAVASTLFWKR